MPVVAGNEVTTTELQQSIFGAPPSSQPQPVKAPAHIEAANGDMEADEKEEKPKGVKRAREEEDEASDDEGAPMEEDSDAPMEASSDEDSD